MPKIIELPTGALKQDRPLLSISSGKLFLFSASFSPGERFNAQCIDKTIDIGGLQIHPNLRDRQQEDALSQKRL